MLKKLHNAARPVFTSLGYRWELWDQRSSTLGVWRKQWRKGSRRLVVVPGFGDSSLSWLAYFLPLTPVIQKQYDELVVMDIAGFHGFLSHEKCGSMDAIIAAVHEALDTLKPQCVFGHSLGGWLAAMWAAKRKPGDHAAEKLILMSPGGLIEREDEFFDWKAMYEMCRDEGFDAYRKYVFAREPVFFPLIAGQFSDFFTRPDILEFMISIRREHFLSDTLKAIDSNVWLIWGDKDGVCLPHWVHDWLGHLNHGGKRKTARAVMIRGAGHVPHIENVVATTAVLAQILRNGSPSWLFGKVIL